MHSFIAADVQKWEDLCSLPDILNPSNYQTRWQALQIYGQIEQFFISGGIDDEGYLQKQRPLQEQLLKLNQQEIDKLRESMGNPDFSPTDFRAHTIALSGFEFRKWGSPFYFEECIDSLVRDLLSIAPGDTTGLQNVGPEKVHHEITPFGALLDLTARLDFNPTDVFFDVGSGHGLVGIFVHLLTGMKVMGVEYQKDLADYGNTVATLLNLKEVDFSCGDALLADISKGTIFFLFTPFFGTLMDSFLHKLKKHAAQNLIRVVSFGDCTLRLAKESWLIPASGTELHRFQIAIFNSAH